MALGRLDQYLYPYYANDVNKGILTRDKALELMGVPFIRYTSTGILAEMTL